MGNAWQIWHLISYSATAFLCNYRLSYPICSSYSPPVHIENRFFSFFMVTVNLSTLIFTSHLVLQDSHLLCIAHSANLGRLTLFSSLFLFHRFLKAFLFQCWLRFPKNQDSRIALCPSLACGCKHQCQHQNFPLSKTDWEIRTTRKRRGGSLLQLIHKI